MLCSICNQDLPDEIMFCPRCGKQRPTTKSSAKAPAASPSSLRPNHPVTGLFSKILQVTGTTAFLIFLIMAISFGGVFGKAFMNDLFQSDKENVVNPTISYVPVTTQRVGAFSVNYPYAFIRNDAETKLLKSATDLNVPGTLQSVDIYTSRPTCGFVSIVHSVGTYFREIELDIDNKAQESSNHISSLKEIQSPESTITDALVSGLPARRVSYRARIGDGIVGIETLIVVDPVPNTTWQLNIVLGAPDTGDYSLLHEAKSCANEVLESVQINRS